jgi:hypothetical protein
VGLVGLVGPGIVTWIEAVETCWNSGEGHFAGQAPMCKLTRVFKCRGLYPQKFLGFRSSQQSGKAPSQQSVRPG